MGTPSEQIRDVKDLLRAMIYRAELPEGARIVEADVRRQSGATFRAVRQALTDLTREGLLNRKRHAGTFVARNLANPVGSVLPPVSTVAVTSSLSRKLFETSQFVSSLMAGIRAALQPPGKIVSILRPGDSGGAIDDLPVISIEEVKASAQGVIGIEANNAMVLNDLVRAGLAVVAIDYYPPRASFDVVAADHQEAGYLATGHLLSLGHRRIAFVGEGPNYRSNDPTWQDRLTGYMRAMAEVAHDGPRQWVLDIHRSGSLIERRLPDFHRRHRITAYVLCSGGLAPAAVSALKGLGLSCPEDVSLACADNAERVIGDRTLSYARADLEQVGRSAVRLLASRLSCRAMPAVRTIIPVEFKPGESSRAPSAEPAR